MSLDAHQKQIIDLAESWIGTPYRHQARTKHVGCDCLGLVLGVWQELGGTHIEAIPNYSIDWAECAAEDKLLGAAHSHFVARQSQVMQQGDVLVFRWSPFSVSKHVGILVEDNQMIHAFERHQVAKTNLVSQWRRRISGVFSFPKI